MLQSARATCAPVSFQESRAPSETYKTVNFVFWAKLIFFYEFNVGMFSQFERNSQVHYIFYVKLPNKLNVRKILSGCKESARGNLLKFIKIKRDYDNFLLS